MTESEWLASTDPAAMLAYLTARPMQSVQPTGTDRWRISGRKLRLWACACCRQVWQLLTDERSRRAVEVAERYADGEATWEEMERWWGEAYHLPAQGDADSPERYAWLWASNLGHCDATGIFAENYRHWPTQAGVPQSLQAALLHDVAGNPFRPMTLPKVAAGAPSAWEPASSTATPGTSRWHACPWLTPAVRSLALAAYQERPGRGCGRCGGTGDRPNGYCLEDPKCPDCRGAGRIDDGALDPAVLGVLSDALEEAGCDDEGVLRHLRGWERCPDVEALRRGIPYGSWIPKRGPCVRGCHVIDLILNRE